MHRRGLGLLWGQSVTRHPTACRCHRGHRFLLAASGIAAAFGNPLPTVAARSALERSTLPKSNQLQIAKYPSLWKGRSCSQSLSLSLLDLFPVGVRDVRNDGMKVWLPQATGLVGVGMSPWSRHGDGQEGLCEGSSSRVHSGSGKHKELQRWEKHLHKFLLKFQLHFSPLIYTIPMRCSLNS